MIDSSCYAPSSLVHPWKEGVGCRPQSRSNETAVGCGSRALGACCEELGLPPAEPRRLCVGPAPRWRSRGLRAPAPRGVLSSSRPGPYFARLHSESGLKAFLPHPCACTSRLVARLEAGGPTYRACTFLPRMSESSLEPLGVGRRVECGGCVGWCEAGRLVSPSPRPPRHPGAGTRAYSGRRSRSGRRSLHVSAPHQHSSSRHLSFSLFLCHR